MLNAFKIKPYDLEPIFAEWKDAPIFSGNPKKDLPVEEWLEKIREGAVARGVPEEYWYQCAQHYMGPKAKARLDELKKVIIQVHGGKYRWTWKKFKLAMLNMGWNIDQDKKETIKVTRKGSNFWFNRKNTTTDTASSSKDSDSDSVHSVHSGHSNHSNHTESAEASTSTPKRQPPSRSGSLWFSSSKTIVEEPEEAEEIITPAVAAAAETKPKLARASTASSFWPSKMNHGKEKDLPTRPANPTAASDSVLVFKRKETKDTKDPKRSQTVAAAARSKTADKDAHPEGGEVVTTAQAPAWLLNACTALEYITSEHPKAMSIVSAILITAGSIPSIPAIAAGAGGAVLASGAAHAIGAIAVGVGQALSASASNAQKKQEGHGSSTSR